MANFKIGETAVAGPFESDDSKTGGNWSTSRDTIGRSILHISFTKVDGTVLPGTNVLSTADANSWSFHLGSEISLDVVQSMMENAKIFVGKWDEKFPGKLNLK